YGRLSSDWKDDIRQAFCECFRVLKPNGTLIFKWNEEQIPFNDAIKLAPQKPLLGDKRGKTRWVVFVNGI
ncbi:MAG: SAM-dependent methyltransferase, partial [Acidaminococcaceae bacterium]